MTETKDERLVRALDWLAAHGVPYPKRDIEIVYYPGGAYINDLLVFSSGLKSEKCSTNLLLGNPVIALGDLYRAGLAMHGMPIMQWLHEPKVAEAPEPPKTGNGYQGTGNPRNPFGGA